MKPRIFISAVSAELASARQVVANVLSRKGYEPDWQQVFGTEPGEIRDSLRKRIDDCEALIQIVGDGYGFERAEPDPKFGRVSYTQFEFLYAQQQGKPTRSIFAEDGCPRDRSVAELDLPADGDHSDPAAKTQARSSRQRFPAICGRRSSRHEFRSLSKLNFVCPVVSVRMLRIIHSIRCKRRRFKESSETFKIQVSLFLAQRRSAMLRLPLIPFGSRIGFDGLSRFDSAFKRFLPNPPDFQAHDTQIP